MYFLNLLLVNTKKSNLQRYSYYSELDILFHSESKVIGFGLPELGMSYDDQ